MRKVLLITYYFPPRPGVASLRLRGVAKYLPEYGWEPVILTAALPGEPEPRFNVVQTSYPGDVTARWKKKLGLAPDNGFQKQIGIPRALRESRASFTSKVINCTKAIIVYPDEQKSWYPFAVSAGHDLLKRERFDALLSSSGPVTCHLIARELKRRHGIPWVADLRDLWTQNHYYPYGLLRRLFERRLELKTLELADVLVTVSGPLAEELQSLHRNKRVLAITNGFDPDEVASVPLTKEFTITYTGQLYEGNRDPALLFQAVHELVADGTIDPLDIRIRFYGEAPYWLEQQVGHYQLGEIVSLHHTVPRDVALTKQRESQVLLLLNRDDPRERGVYTGKIFEYLAAKRPILALGGPGGVVAQLLKETGAGVHVNLYDHLKAFLSSWYQEYKTEGEVRYKGQWEAVHKYSHREMARRFAYLLDEITGGGLANR
ncbi:glycosyltransferase [Candidatus Bipolaricaulota bacterium]|nr:glycosyltransferase [Candidatus Bipolaricaulota bacterium]